MTPHMPAAGPICGCCWRHPVYGDRDVWVVQRPFPRFYAAVRPSEAAARKACEDAVQAVFNQIARAL